MTGGSAGGGRTPYPPRGNVVGGRPGATIFGFPIPSVFTGAATGHVAAWVLATAVGTILFMLVLRRGDPSRRLAGLPGLAAAYDAAVAQAQRAVARSAQAVSPPRVAAPAPHVDPPRPRSRSLRGDRDSPQSGAAARMPLRFAKSPARGVERRTIAYRMVRVSEAPDDVRSAEVGRLDRGDEVDVLEYRDGAARVRAPGGLEGWVPSVAVLGPTEARKR